MLVAILIYPQLFSRVVCVCACSSDIVLLVTVFVTLSHPSLVLIAYSLAAHFPFLNVSLSCVVQVSRQRQSAVVLGGSLDRRRIHTLTQAGSCTSPWLTQVSSTILCAVINKES